MRFNPLTPRAQSLAAWAWIALLIVFSLQPLRLRAIASGRPLHPLVHALMFGLAALLSLIRNARRTQRLIRTAAILLVAAGLETAQSMFYGHRTEWTDVWSDAFGVLIVVVATRVAVRVKKRASP